MHFEKSKKRNATKSPSPQGSQRNDYQQFKISDSLCFCAFVAKLYFSEWTYCLIMVYDFDIPFGLYKVNAYVHEARSLRSMVIGDKLS